MKRLAIIAAVALGACAAVETTSIASRPLDQQTFVSVGDTMVRVDLEESLPNAFGYADIFGRTRDLGFSELRYMGLSPEGFPVFRRRDVDVLTNETAVSRAGLGAGVITARPSGSGFIATGVTTRAPSPSIEALPPDTMEFALDLSQGRSLTVRDRVIEILSASPSGVSFVVR